MQCYSLYKKRRRHYGNDRDECTIDGFMRVVQCKGVFPEMDKLELGENDYDKKYPRLWLYHSDGGSSMDWLCTPAEKCAVENGIFIIAKRCSALSVYQYGVWTKI